MDVENEQEFTHRKSLGPNTEMQAPPAHNENPYLEGLTHNRSHETEWVALQRALKNFDEINKMAEYNIENSVWERLYRARLKKANKEMELKVATQRRDNTIAFLKVCFRRVVAALMFSH